jgi:cytoskeletal protein RodZ
MSENTEMVPQQAKEEPTVDRAGDILRKERITRRIALETIAKDLKLNVKYIKALEANDYSGLPADPYVRVYFRSIAKYLLLDPEEILKRFYEERGIPPESYKKDKDSKLTISLVENKRSNRPLVIVIAVIVGLAAFSFIANKFGWISSASTDQTADGFVGKKQHTEGDTRNATGADSAEDSLIGALIPHHETAPIAAPAVAFPPTPANAPAKGAATDKKQITVLDTIKQLSLEIKALKDSVWVQIFSDGQSWKKYLYANQSKKFTARDSFNVHVGNNSLLRYTYNNKPLIINASDVVVFKLSRSSPNPEMWNLAKWAGVFKNRS